MKLNRNFVTPLIALVFLVVGFSGVLMYFHLFDGYTEIVHEYLGLTFVVFSIFHIIINWGDLKSHFRKKIFIPAGIVVLVISIGFIVLEKIYVPIDIVLIEKLVKAPISDSFRVLEIDYSKASQTLENNGIFIGDSKTIEDIWIKNESSPQEVIELIIK